MTEEFIKLCARKLSGETSVRENHRLSVLLGRDPEKRAFLEELEEQWNGMKKPEVDPFDAVRAFARLEPKLTASRSARESEVAPFDAEKAFARLEAKLALRPAMKPVAVPEPVAEIPMQNTDGNVVAFPRRRRLSPWMAAAAAVAIIAGSAIWVGHPAFEPKTPWVASSTAKGERTEVILADGTRVTLNADSSLSYPKAFGKSSREVRLTGEAFFEVTADASRPFTVEAGGLRTTVLGTKFNVSAFPNGTASVVSLVEGKVAVESLAGDQAASRVLTAGQQLTADRANGGVQVTAFTADAVLDWTHGALVFADDTIESVAQKIERRFGVTVEITDRALAKKTLSGHFEREGLKEVLDMLSFTGGVRYDITTNANGAPSRILISPAR